MPAGRAYLSTAGPRWRKAGCGSSLQVTPIVGVAAEGEARSSQFSRVALLWVALLLPAVTTAAEAAGDRIVRFDISRQRADKALIEFAEQADVTFIFPADEARKVMANKVRGEFTPQAAIAKLLEGTGLEPRVQADGALTVNAEQGSTDKGEIVKKRGLLAGIVAALVGAAAVDAGADQATETDTAPTRLGEILVTAQKRQERLQDVPISMTALTADEISQRGLVSAEDYLRGIPGVNQGSTITGSSVIIRGLETTPSFQNFSSGPTTATYFGETPTTNTGGLSSNGSVDIKLVDIERVEVLRGPQGTAFGSASLGGAVRTIPAAAKLDGFEGKVATHYSVTSGFGDDNHMIQAVGNVPIVANKFGIRAVAYRFSESGFYRNVAASTPAFLDLVGAIDPTAVVLARDVDDIGAAEFTGGRISALWQTTDDLSFTASYLTQKTEVDGLPLTNLAEPYEQVALPVAPEHVRRGVSAGITDTDIDLANFTMEYDLRWADLLASFSRIESGSELTRPYSAYVGTVFAGMPFGQLALSDHEESVAEIRLATKFDGPWNFLGGFYWEDMEDQTVFPFVWYGDPAASPFGGVRYPGNNDDYRDQRDLEQRAFFVEGSWEFVPGWTLTGGGRAYNYERTVHVETQGILYGDQITTDVADESDTTFRANLSYRPNEDMLLYAGWGEGFRLGKPQPGLPPSQCDLNGDGQIDGSNESIASTKSVDSDTVDNTELGGKFTLLDRRLQISAAVFRINWNGMPFLTRAPDPPAGCGLNYITNAGSARSEGVEAQLVFNLSPALQVDLGGSYIDARLTQDVPNQGLPSGARLPGSPEWNANLALQYGFKIRQHDAFVRADSIYVGTFSSVMPYSEAFESGGYIKHDLTAGVAIGKFNVDVFVRNLTDIDDLTFNDTLVAYRLRPRTIGLQLAYHF